MAKQKPFGVIYCIVNILEWKMYVGQTIDLPRRINQHKHNIKSLIGQAIHKYGWDNNFLVQVLDECASFEEMNEREKFWIEELNSLAPNGYNLLRGGNSSEELRQLMLKNNTRRKAVICLETLEIFQSLTDASNKTHIEGNNIGRACRGLLVTAGSKHWMYLSDWLKATEEEVIKVMERSSFPQQIPVRCISTNEIFESIAEAERKTGIAASSIGQACSGIRKSAGEKLWEYLKPHLHESYRTNAKAVVCMETGEIFKCIADAARKYGIPTVCISRVCRGESATAGNFHWCYLEDWLAADEETRNKQMSRSSYPNKKAVRCLETGEVFEAIRYAANKCGIDEANLRRVCEERKGTAGGYHWIYESDWLAADEETKKKILEMAKIPPLPRKRKVRCIETGKIYESIAEAARCTGIAACCISAVCNGRNKTAGNYHWEFVDEEIVTKK